MRRGESWTVAGGKDYAAKPSPIVIVQEHSFDATGSITICAFTTDETEAPLFRLPVEANERHGLRATCRLMVDKITTVPKSKAGARVGRLDDEDVLRLNQAMLVFLGLAMSPKASPREKHRGRLIGATCGLCFSPQTEHPADDPGKRRREDTG